MIRQHPHSLRDGLDDIEELAEVCGADSLPLMARLRRRIEAASAKAAELPRVRGVFLEWIDPPYRAGHWTPDLWRSQGSRIPWREPACRRLRFRGTTLGRRNRTSSSWPPAGSARPGQRKRPITCGPRSKQREPPPSSCSTDPLTSTGRDRVLSTRSSSS